MENNREKVIIRTSIIGIIANVLLSAFKAVIGLMTHSVAITMDAVNNISDAASSLITIIGTKLASKEPDKKHPFGYGRIEYLSAMIISVLVLYAGITALVESIKKIITPETPDYSAAALIIVAAAVIVKFLLGRYVKSVGEKVNSDSLVNSGTDATLDSVISASTLVAAGIYLIWGVSLEAYLGAIISLVIIKAGFDMLKETISRILGENVDPDVAKAVEDTILSFPDISGVYDFILNDYGPETRQGSAHIEVPDTYTANDLDKLIRDISVKVYMEHKVILTGIGIYSVNTRDEAVIQTRENVKNIALSHDHVVQLHGFYMDEANKTLRFDLVIDFDAENRREVFRAVVSEIQKAYPDYKLTAAMDTNYIGE